jgi:hypothetical protein
MRRNSLARGTFLDPSIRLPDPAAGILHRPSLARRDIFLWAAIILFSNHLLSAATASSPVAIWKALADLAAVGIFPYMAWYAVFRLVATSDPAPSAGWRDLVVSILLCLLVFLPTSRMIWVAALGIGAYLIVFGSGDRQLRAAGFVLGALAVQQFWGHVFFDLIASPLLRAETAVVGTVLEITHPGTVWHDNVVTRPNGYGVILFGDCSSFHNLSLALLCWTTLTSLRQRHWQARALFGAVLVGGVMVSLNFIRIYLMALNINYYHYWHDEAGAEIFGVGASLAVLILSLYCTRPSEAA